MTESTPILFSPPPSPTPLPSPPHLSPSPPMSHQHPALLSQPLRQPSPSPPASHHETSSDTQAFVKDDIKVEYHPRSGRKERVFRFEDYERERPTARVRDSDPWHPFACRDDFEFADALLQCGMRRKQIETVLRIVKRISQGQSDFSLWSFEDLESSWKQAALFHASASIFYGYAWWYLIDTP